MNTILEFLEEWSYFGHLLMVILAFCIGYFGRMYEDKAKTLYYFTEAELNQVYRRIWEKGRYLGNAKSPIIPSKEWLKSMCNTHIHEAIDEQLKDNK